MKKEVLGILAGRGELPWICARNAIAAGQDVRVFCITDEEPPEEFKKISVPVVLTKLYSSVFRSFREYGARRIILIGKATRDILYKKPRFDLRTILLLARMTSQSDTNLFQYVLQAFEKHGFTILPQDLYLKNMYLPTGRYGKSLSKKEIEDIAFGMVYAREINRLDLGQTLVAAQLSVLAVECAEGTDQCIRRGGELYHKKGAVVCKVAKVDHDKRFDLPVTGISTLESMRDSGCRVLAIESGKTMVLNHVEFVKTAEKYKISIVSCDPDKSDVKTISKICRSAAKL
ncbi:MAG: UDP-2,3-diacylglucosamine diphosphatase LpxI [Spirochaetia bacterium]|nr:UDP-2,3-diacylglucosamine diphosphatase LpxI [Spirochaetia bacterium]